MRLKSVYCIRGDSKDSYGNTKSLKIDTSEEHGEKHTVELESFVKRSGVEDHYTYQEVSAHHTEATKHSTVTYHLNVEGSVETSEHPDVYAKIEIRTSGEHGADSVTYKYALVRDAGVTFTVDISEDHEGEDISVALVDLVVAANDAAASVNDPDISIGADSIADLFSLALVNVAPVVALVDVTGAVTEQVTPSGNLTDTGTIAFSDVDVTDTHTVTVAANSNLGTLTPTISSATVNGSGGVISWSYSVADSVVEYLAKDQTKVESFTITLDDGNGGSVDRIINVTITGTNDVPVVAVVDITGAVIEQTSTPSGNLTDVGTIAFSDVDLTDTHSVSVAAVGSHLGTLIASVSPDVTNGTGGLISWGYSVADSSVEYLAQGQTKLEVFTVTLNDGHGGTVDRTVSVTITGTNDAAVINGTSTASVTEDSGSYVKTGSLTVVDVDTQDTNTFRAVTDEATTYGKFSMTTGGTWTYTADNANKLQALSTSAEATDTFAVTAADGTTHNVVVTLNGVAETASPALDLNLSGASSTGSGWSASYLEQASAISIADTDSSITDTDSSNMKSATIILTNAKAGDQLTVGSLPSGISSSIDTSVSGKVTVTLTGSATKSNYETAIEAVKFSNTSNTPDTTTRLIDVSVVDSTNNVSNIAVSTISVTAVNDAPTVSAALTSEKNEGDASYTLDLLGGAIDAEGDSLSVSNVTYKVGSSSSSSSVPTGLSITDATLTVDPTNATFNSLKAGATKVIEVSYTVSDGHGGTVAQTETITITGTNDAPTVSAALTSGKNEGDSSYTLSLKGNATDVDSGDTLSITNVTYKVDSGSASSTAPAGISLSGTSLTVDPTDATYNTLKAGATKVILVSYTITDSNGGTVAQTETITITGTNDAPTLTSISSGSVSDSASSANTSSPSSLSGTLSGADVDVGDTITYGVSGSSAASYTASSVTYDLSKAGTYGTLYLEVATGKYLYVPNASSIDLLGTGDSPSDVFTLSVTDGSAASTTRSFTVDITGANETVTGTSGADTLAGSAGADTFTGNGAADTFTVNNTLAIGGSGNSGTITGYDVITDYKGSESDKLDVAGTPTVLVSVAAISGTDSTLTISGRAVKSHAISSGGIITFDDNDTYSSSSLLSITSTPELAAVVQYLQNNDWGNAGATFAFKALISSVNHTYIFTQTTDSAGSGQLVDLTGVSLTSLISTGSSSTAGFVKPIAIDLNGDGVQYLNHSAGVTHDYNQDGVTELTAWVGGSDGILSIQRQDGSLNIVFSTQDGETDLQGLARVYDVNQDGILDQQDGSFTSFGVWQDANSDGVLDAGEFRLFTDLGIASVGLVSDGQINTAAGGDVHISGATTYTMVDGSTGVAEDVALSVTYIKSLLVGVEEVVAENSSSLTAQDVLADNSLNLDNLFSSAVDTTTAPVADATTAPAVDATTAPDPAAIIDQLALIALEPSTTNLFNTQYIPLM